MEHDENPRHFFVCADRLIKEMEMIRWPTRGLVQLVQSKGSNTGELYELHGPCVERVHSIYPIRPIYTRKIGGKWCRSRDVLILRWSWAHLSKMNKTEACETWSKGELKAWQQAKKRMMWHPRTVVTWYDAWSSSYMRWPTNRVVARRSLRTRWSTLLEPFIVHDRVSILCGNFSFFIPLWNWGKGRVTLLLCISCYYGGIASCLL